MSEEAVLKWYKDGHATKGKSIFLDQLKKFVEWLQNAEEGKLFWKLDIYDYWIHEACWKYLFYENLDTEQPFFFFFQLQSPMSLVMKRKTKPLCLQNSGLLVSLLVILLSIFSEFLNNQML